MLGDLLGSVAAIVAALVILWTGWTPIDPLLSLLVAGLILRSAWELLRRSAHILLEGAPDWLDVDELRTAVIAALPAIRDIHHVHVWMLTTERPLITLHAEVAPGADHQQALAAIRGVLEDRFGIDHATIQIETAGCADHGPGCGRGLGEFLHRARGRLRTASNIRLMLGPESAFATNAWVIGPNEQPCWGRRTFARQNG